VSYGGVSLGRIVKEELFLETQGKINLAPQRHIPEDTYPSFDNYKNSIIIYCFNV
jgi:hypothetical protein